MLGKFVKLGIEEAFGGHEHEHKFAEREKDPRAGLAVGMNS